MVIEEKRIVSKKEAETTFLPIIELATRHFVWIVFIIYASGFIVWNLYLSHFGYFEYNIVQARFLSAGLALWIPIVVFSILSIFIESKIPTRYPTLKSSVGLIAGTIMGIWFSSFFLIFFPQLPQSLGGAKPLPISIIGTPDEISYLSNFAIDSAPNAEGKPSVQTNLLCLIYQNDQYALLMNTVQTSTSSDQNGKLHIGLDSRLLSLSREQFLGYQQMVGPGVDAVCDFSGVFLYGSALVRF